MQILLDKNNIFTIFFAFFILILCLCLLTKIRFDTKNIQKYVMVLYW